MKIAIITCTTPNRKWLYDITNPTKEKYCKLHGFDYIFTDNYTVPNVNIYWYKIGFISKVISEKYDWIVWLDDDAGFINFDFDLEKFINDNCENYSILGAKDFNGFNAGVLFVKSTPEMKETFKFILNKMEPIYKNNEFPEQEAIQKISEDTKSIKYVDGKIINAYDRIYCRSPLNQRCNETAILHIACGSDYKEKHKDLIRNLYKENL